MGAKNKTKRNFSGFDPADIFRDFSASISRREAMRRGLIFAAGLFMADKLSFAAPVSAAQVAKTQPRQKAKAVIQIFLWGGMSHTDTWDPKPNAGYDYTGQFKGTLPTNVDGIQISELFPALARQADKYSIIRSMTHHNNGHETAAYLMQTGHLPGEQISYPCIGAIFALLKGYQAGYKGLIPPYVVLTQSQGRFPESGFLSSRYKPFATGGDPNASRFEVEGVVARGISDERQKARREFLQKMNTMGNLMEGNPELAVAREAERQAYDLILGKGKDVFDLSREDPELRNRYGRNTFGQDCLMARRLVEAGVVYVTINYPGGWDTHSNHFQTMRRQCPHLDQGLAMLLQDLSDRGLLKDTIVWCCGEFGRTPKVDWQPPWNGGRGHYGNVFSVLVAGGGFKGGRIVGASDEKGEEIKERPVYPIDLLGSIYDLAGIDTDTKLPHPLGLDARVLAPDEKGAKSAGRLKEIMEL
ncbi:MAG: DUF1501 domain-containing protein [Kiritimatiellae bacterium]|nr:DUF1501 domain-containing protein [Kiritimatiellia bacterium]